MSETKTTKPQEVSIDSIGFYPDKVETPKEVIKLSEKLKNMEPKPDTKNIDKKEVVEKVEKFEVTLKKKSTKNNVDHWVEDGDNKKVFHFGRLPIYSYVAKSLGLSENSKIKIRIERV
ncbi:MAG: hypothetical protein M1371_04055 [Actinobacteria bacterium]|nr:hypothetical protein [Actinomycetota bacterium]MCL5985722.1 hypothetical protein [Actinomycetota bacterium]